MQVGGVADAVCVVAVTFRTVLPVELFARGDSVGLTLVGIPPLARLRGRVSNRGQNASVIDGRIMSRPGSGSDECKQE